MLMFVCVFITNGYCRFVISR